MFIRSHDQTCCFLLSDAQQSPNLIVLKVDSLASVCKAFKKGDVVRLSVNDADSFVVSIVRQGSSGKRTSAFKLHQLSIPSTSEIVMPDRAYDCQAVLPASVFVSVCNELKNAGETIYIAMKDNEIQFKGTGAVSFS